MCRSRQRSDCSSLANERWLADVGSSRVPTSGATTALKPNAIRRPGSGSIVQDHKCPRKHGNIASMSRCRKQGLPNAYILRRRTFLGRLRGRCQKSWTREAFGDWVCLRKGCPRESENRRHEVTRWRRAGDRRWRCRIANCRGHMCRDARDGMQGETILESSLSLVPRSAA